MKIIIMAGGGGTRLWPMSTKAEPKQYQALIGDRTMIQLTYDRLTSAFAPEDIFVAVNKNFTHMIEEQLPDIPKENIFAEPDKRDTAPAMGYVCTRLLKRGFGDEAIAFLPSDHLIKDNELFIQTLQVADKVIRDTGKMVDIGVVPTFPNTNLGYIHVGENVMHEQGIDLREFKKQVEKPPYEKAKEYVDSGDYLWHASYFMWTPRKFLDAFEQYVPKMYKDLMEIYDALATDKEDDVVESVFPKLEKISIDYAIAEKIDPSNMLIVPAKFYWSDVGLWQVIKKEQQESDEDNVTKGEYVSLDTKNCLIYSKKKKVIATVGLEDMIIVDTDDALLICPQDRDKDVKKIVEILEEKGKTEFL